MLSIIHNPRVFVFSHGHLLRWVLSNDIVVFWVGGRIYLWLKSLWVYIAVDVSW